MSAAGEPIKKPRGEPAGFRVCINQEERIDTGGDTTTADLGIASGSFKPAAVSFAPVRSPAPRNPQAARLTLLAAAALVAFAAAARTLASARSTTCFVAFWN